MGERSQEPEVSESLDEIFDPAMGDLMDEETEELIVVSSEKHRLAEKRRRAEQRLEELRLRDELGYYDLDLEDF